MPDCIFCKIVSGEIKAHTVFENDEVVVFLDSGPLFPGHSLVVPKVHYDTLMDLPAGAISHLFTIAQRVCRAVESALAAQGSFVAINNKISQSVPHLHVHVVPRSKGDGLKGFFWPRRPYKDEAEAAETAEKLREALVTEA